MGEGEIEQWYRGEEKEVRLKEGENEGEKTEEQELRMLR